ncbi:FAD-dependent oxidoreductase [Mesorhizobium sp. M7A.F.Ca.CA.004.06.1.1]|uniref:GcvT family protein n=7 Tax=unclassified Mesorhizobium TaxID=325217 RepID=UPI000FCBB873|nr:FAD-dependent oxidoreductase [Mesorhizobium sp. M7A.F.Ca.CA.004.06.1.1]RVB75665.1 FAD-dependent oxidoreductase [Mesorhizobium sp. M7A.F.Ca.CA.004.06.1.1]
MKSHAKVVVIGGGVVGCSVLFHLARHGWTDVVLLERDELTSGSTWHAAGGMHTINGDPNVAKLQKYTINLYKEIEELSGQATGVHLTGGVLLAATEARLDWLRGVVAKGRYLGIELEEISPNEAAELMPLLDPKQFVGAVRNKEDGHLDPSGVTHAYAKAARKLGAEVERFTKVEDIVRRPDGLWRVITNKGEVVAEHVVNAGGLWAREVGRMVGLELPVLAMEHMYLITEDMPEVAAWNAKTGTEIIHAVDFDGELYLRQERGGMLMGTYEKANKPWSEYQTPWNFGHELLEPDIDRIAPSLEVGFRHFPAFQNTGIKQIINGPFTFAPDGNPLVGPVRGLPGFWVACGVMAGFSQGGGVGLALSNWMIEGDPGADIWAMDVARYGDWATMAYTNAKVRENYSRRFSIRFPNEELPAGRPLKTTPIYDLLSAGGAQWGVAYGLEVPLWYAPEGVKDEFSWRRSSDFTQVAKEVATVRDSVGLSEISSFAKYQVTGEGAAAWLDRMLTCKLPKPGRMTLAPMLKQDGRLIGDFTLANLGEDGWFLAGSGIAEQYHMRWFEKHLPKDGTVRIHRFDQTLVGLSIAGPKSRDLLQKLVDVDVSTKAFRFMDFREMAVGGAPCMVNRITYTGDLGYEIWMAPAYERLVYKAIKDAGEEFGLVDFGMRALLSMRLEKNFPTWFRELRPIYGPFEGAMDRFIKLEKNDFIGREAAAKEQAEGPKLRRVSFIVDATDADVMGDEPIWAKVSKDYGTVEKPHGYGAPRFDEGGKEIRGSKATEGASAVRGIVDGDWRVVGWVTSGGYAHYVQKSMAQGYVPAALAEDESAGLFEIEILGHRRPARINVEAPFDPSGEKMRT